MWIAAAAVVVAAGCGHAPVTPLADSPEWAEAHRKAAFRDSGENLGRAQAEQVTAHLEEAPDDLVGREKLLYFYAANGTRFYDPAVVVAARRKHILWLIGHHPEDPILAQPAGVLRAVDDPAGLAQAKKLWQAKGDSPNAAAWLRIAEPPPVPTESVAGSEAAAGLHHAEWLQKAEDGDRSVGAVAALIEKACEESDWDQARKLADQTLRVGVPRNDPDYGTAVFQAHIAMGILAMRTGDRKLAVDHLQQAVNGPVTEDLQYRSQADVYRLLAWLLKDGERESVIQFLERFAKTSVVDRDRLTQSVDLVRKNQKPVWYP